MRDLVIEKVEIKIANINYKEADYIIRSMHWLSDRTRWII